MATQCLMEIRLQRREVKECQPEIKNRESLQKAEIRIRNLSTFINMNQGLTVQKILYSRKNNYGCCLDDE